MKLPSKWEIAGEYYSNDEQRERLVHGVSAATVLTAAL